MTDIKKWKRIASKYGEAGVNAFFVPIAVAFMFVNGGFIFKLLSTFLGVLWLVAYFLEEKKQKEAMKEVLEMFG